LQRQLTADQLARPVISLSAVAAWPSRARQQPAVSRLRVGQRRPGSADKRATRAGASPPVEAAPAGARVSYRPAAALAALGCSWLPPGLTGLTQELIVWSQRKVCGRLAQGNGRNPGALELGTVSLRFPGPGITSCFNSVPCRPRRGFSLPRLAGGRGERQGRRDTLVQQLALRHTTSPVCSRTGSLRDQLALRESGNPASLCVSHNMLHYPGGRLGLC